MGFRSFTKSLRNRFGVKAQVQKEEDSLELIAMNFELKQLNRMFNAMVNTLGEGFFLIDRSFYCLSVYSKACETLLECAPGGMPAWQVLGILPEKRQAFDEWLKLVFDDQLDFLDLVELGPKTFSGANGDRKIEIEYKPVRNADGRLENLLVIATDRTAEQKAKEEVQTLRSLASLMLGVMKDKPRFRRFVSAVRGIFRDLYVNLNGDEFSAEGFAEVKRRLHTLKGAAATFGLDSFAEAVHQVESRLVGDIDLESHKSLLLGEAERLEDLFESILTAHNGMLSEFLVERSAVRSIPIRDLEDFAKRLRRLGPMVDTAHAEFVAEILAVPLRRIFSEFDAVIQQVAQKLGKKVDSIYFIGDEVSLMPESFEPLRASLVHIFRNIVDHGIESAAVRKERAKLPSGRVVVEFRSLENETGPYLRIIINDDGNGIDTQRVRSKLQSLGKHTDLMTHEQVLDSIFEPGFSTAVTVNEFSGRGVGLDAVRVEVEKLGGKINVRSEIGKGSAFVIELPFESVNGLPKLRSSNLRAA